MLGAFIPIIIILVFLSSYIIVFIDDKDPSRIESKLTSIIFPIILVFCIFFLALFKLNIQNKILSDLIKINKYLFLIIFQLYYL